MRIAYIAPYQGPGLLKSRPIVTNLSLAGSIKTELIAGLLSENNHEVEIISQGEVVQLQCKRYPAFCESTLLYPNIPVYYASALPVRFLNGLWSSRQTLGLLKSRHWHSPYDLVIIYNLKLPQLVSAKYAIQRLGVPVVFQYEDDAFVDIAGKVTGEAGFKGRLERRRASVVLPALSGCMAASPHLLSQVSPSIPKLLMRGVIGKDILDAVEQRQEGRKNWVLFSGTLQRIKGIEQLITAWRTLDLPDWELHITGDGDLASTLRTMSEDTPRTVFHGLVSRLELVRLMCLAKICINPHDVSHTPGNIFAFKIIEYLAAGAHVISTPMGSLEKEVERGMTYIPDNSPETIAVALKQVILAETWSCTAKEYVIDSYGPRSMARILDELLQQASAYYSRRKGHRC